MKNKNKIINTNTRLYSVCEICSRFERQYTNNRCSSRGVGDKLRHWRTVRFLDMVLELLICDPFLHAIEPEFSFSVKYHLRKRRLTVTRRPVDIFGSEENLLFFSHKESILLLATIVAKLVRVKICDKSNYYLANNKKMYVS